MDQTAEKIVCRQCYCVLDAGDNFCRQCGLATPQMAARLGQAGMPTAAAGATAGGRVAAPPAFWESPWVILPALFLLLGPLALPMLWRSRRFSLLWKTVLTFLVTVTTVLAIWWPVHKMNEMLAPLMRDLEGVRGL